MDACEAARDICCVDGMLNDALEEDLDIMRLLLPSLLKTERILLLLLKCFIGCWGSKTAASSLESLESCGFTSIS